MTTKLRTTAEPPEVEEGQHTVTIDRIVVDEENIYNGETRPQAIWTFLLSDGETEVKGWTSLSFFEGSDQFPPSKLYQWFKTLKTAPSGENEFDFDELVGTKVSVIIGKNKKGWPKVEKIVKLVSPAANRLEKAAEDVKADWAEDAVQKAFAE